MYSNIWEFSFHSFSISMLKVLFEGLAAVTMIHQPSSPTQRITRLVLSLSRENTPWQIKFFGVGNCMELPKVFAMVATVCHRRLIFAKTRCWGMLPCLNIEGATSIESWTYQPTWHTFWQISWHWHFLSYSINDIHSGGWRSDNLFDIVRVQIAPIWRSYSLLTKRPRA